MPVSTESIRVLRELTGAGIMDCKRALEDSAGNFEKAEEILRKKGIALAAKKSSRVAHEGLIEAYIHNGSRIGAIIELNCETDFVARTPAFRELAHGLAMQVAAMSPLYIDQKELPVNYEGNPQEQCLLLQPFIKDPARSVQDLVNDAIARVGENIRVKRFVRFALGE
ncbi:MAG: elongation factor Ts [Chloroflexi bacterium]|nr:elongation factor Ts [Chloroflexota bacterium]